MRVSHRPYSRSRLNSMPPVVPSAVPDIVITPFATAIWDGRRLPLPLWPGPS